MELEKIRQAAEKNNGFIRTYELREMKIDYRGVQRLIRDGELIKIKNGLYKLPGGDSSEEELVAGLFPDGVLCMESALYYHGYTSLPPLKWNIAVDKDTSKSRFDIGYPFVKPFYYERDQLMIGAVPLQMGSARMYVYDKERTICDCLKFENKMDRSLYNQAIRAYIDDPDKNAPLLFEYAMKRRIYKKAKNILGVWL
ncbi:MAG: type IV toxin-antitoxin system AbiEi family antitoxin domain-containing protein [Lachnospiraceae bacterium]|nr:type IV toxin-antitoxin system AbiEi family antitoxin domain-containing protein [Lachnospiraceae bacterium]